MAIETRDTGVTAAYATVEVEVVVGFDATGQRWRTAQEMATLVQERSVARLATGWVCIGAGLAPEGRNMLVLFQKRPAPVITGITPATLQFNAASVTMTLAGQLFDPTHVVFVNNVQAPTTTYTSDFELKATFSTQPFAHGQIIPIHVVTTDGNQSNVMQARIA